MGQLVRFAKRNRTIPEHSTENRRGQVLMFTGVRYERGSTKPDNQQTGPKDASSDSERKRG